MKGFTVICNSCDNKIQLNEKVNPRFNLKEGFWFTIHSNVEGGFYCRNCENKVILKDK